MFDKTDSKLGVLQFRSAYERAATAPKYAFRKRDLLYFFSLKNSFKD